MEDDQAQSLLDTLKRAAAALADAGIEFAVTGGAAAYARGAGPPHKDVDIVLMEQDAGAALHALEQAGMRPVDPPEDWLVKAYDDDRLVDLIFRPVGRPVTPDLLRRAERLVIDGLDVPVVDATDLLVMRMLAFSEHACDFTDVLPWARIVREQVDWDRVREETAGAPFAEAFLVLLERLDVVAPAGTTHEDGDR